MSRSMTKHEKGRRGEAVKPVVVARVRGLNSTMAVLHTAAEPL